MKCEYCLKEKKGSDFRTLNRSRCKECLHQYRRIYVERKKDDIRAYYRKWYAQNGRNRAVDYTEAVKEWMENHPKELIAHQKLRKAIRKGILNKPDHCSKCGRQTKISGHHPDYSKPLEVIWMCSSCHKLEHTI